MENQHKAFSRDERLPMSGDIIFKKGNYPL